MSVIVYQTFEMKQEKFKEGLDNLLKIKEFRNKNYSHHLEILTPISGRDHTFTLLATYEGLAEMELQNKKMFDDEDYLQLIGQFFIEDIVQGSMNTQLFRVMKDKPEGKEKEKK